MAVVIAKPVHVLLAEKIAKSFYPEAEAVEIEFAAEQVVEFAKSEKRKPRCAAELDAYSNSAEEFAAYMLANPVQTAPAVAPVNPAIAENLNDNFVPAAPIQNVTVSVSLESLNKAEIAKHIKAKWGYTAPMTWKKSEMIDGFNGKKFPRSGKAKAELLAAYSKKSGGVAAPKSWTCAKLAQAVGAEVTPIGKSKTAKQDAIRAYVATMGYMPAKTWNAETIVANTKSKTLPKIAKFRVKAIVSGNEVVLC